MKVYGWIYDKKGNKRIVSQPVYGNGKPVPKPRKTLTGTLPDNIGLYHAKHSK